jgi:hypothetical protein
VTYPNNGVEFFLQDGLLTGCTLRASNRTGGEQGMWANGSNGSASTLTVVGRLRFLATPTSPGGCNGLLQPAQGEGSFTDGWDIRDVSQANRSITVTAG